VIYEPWGFMPEVAMMVIFLLGLAFHPWGFVMMEKPDIFHENYQMGQLYLEGGWYTRGELEGLLAHLDQMNKLNESYVKEISDEQRHE
jgi:hypothetical protein